MTDDIIEDENLSKVFVGTIIKSMLPKKAFFENNGRRFVLCDGSSASGTDYEKLTGRTNVPDLRGLFVRQQGDKSADLGDIQDASINKDHFEIKINWNQAPNQTWGHSHKILSRVAAYPNANITANDDGVYQYAYGQPDEEQFILSTAPDGQKPDAGVTDTISVTANVPRVGDTKPAGIKVRSDIQGDTRPVNIALYYYICVWEDEPVIPDDIHDHENHKPNPITCNVYYNINNDLDEPVTDNFRLLPVFDTGGLGYFIALRQVTNAPLPFGEVFDRTSKLREKMKALRDFEPSPDMPEPKIDFDDIIREDELAGLCSGKFSESYLKKYTMEVEGPLGNLEYEIVNYGNCDVHVRGNSNTVYRFKFYPFQSSTDLVGDVRECLQFLIGEVYYLNFSNNWQLIEKEDDLNFVTVDCLESLV